MDRHGVSKVRPETKGEVNYVYTLTNQSLLDLNNDNNSEENELITSGKAVLESVSNSDE